MSFNLYGLFIVLIALFPVSIEYLFKLNRKYNHLQLRNLSFISIIGLIFFSLFNVFGYGYHIINNTLAIIGIIFIGIVVLIYYIFFIISFVKRNKYIKLFYRLNVKLYRGLVFLIPSIFFFNPYILFFSILYIITEIIIEVK